MEREVLKLQKNELIHAKMSDFVLNLGRNLSYYGEDAWTDQNKPIHHGRNSDHANEVMRFPGLEMFIYGERFTKKRVNSQING